MPLRVIIADDENRPDLARAIAQTFVNDPHVLGVVGHCDSEAALAAAAIYQQNKLVAISPLSTAVDLSNAGSYAPGATGTVWFYRLAIATKGLTSSPFNRAIAPALASTLCLLTLIHHRSTPAPSDLSRVFPPSKISFDVCNQTIVLLAMYLQV